MQISEAKPQANFSEETEKTSLVSKYEAPQIKDLGSWKTMTLLYSLPIGPGGRSTHQDGPLY